jgi:hypothetical protein
LRRDEKQNDDESLGIVIIPLSESGRPVHRNLRFTANGITLEIPFFGVFLFFIFAQIPSVVGA